MKNMLLENLIKEQVKLVLNEILLESFKDAERIFVQQSDLPIEDIKIKLQTFKDLAKKNQIKNPKEKDIGYWIKQGFEKFNKFISQFEGVETKTQQIKKTKSEESITAYEDDQHLVVIPLSKKASCFYGKETRWCTAATKGENLFDDYFFGEIILFYVINKKTGEKYAAAYNLNYDEFELFDAEDEEISAEDFPFDLDLLRNLAKKHSKQIENIREQITNRFKGKDLSGQDLRGRIFAGFNFKGTNLEEANLEEANLYKANLEDANLQKANLRGTNLNEVSLREADLQGANLVNADLTYANLTYANLEEANLENAYLRDANLKNANLRDTNLKGANLGGTNLIGTSFLGANLQKTDFRGANLKGLNVEDLIARGAIVE